jgi:DNA repair ATPase RecN
MSLAEELGIIGMEEDVKKAEDKVKAIKAKPTSTVEAEDAREALGEFLGVKLESVKDIHDEFSKLSNKLDDTDRALDEAKSKISEIKKILKVEWGEGKYKDFLKFLGESDEPTIAKSEAIDEPPKLIEAVPEESFAGALNDL